MTVTEIIKNSNVSGYFLKDDLSLSGAKHNRAYSKPNRVKGSFYRKDAKTQRRKEKKRKVK